jgi:hypothetical protein
MRLRDQSDQASIDLNLGRVSNYENERSAYDVRRHDAPEYGVSRAPMGGIVTELKSSLDERALDRLTLATDAAVLSYQRERLRLQAARQVRHNRQRVDLTQKKVGGDDEIA